MIPKHATRVFVPFSLFVAMDFDTTLKVDGKVALLGLHEGSAALSCNQIYNQLKPTPDSGNFWIKSKDWLVICFLLDVSSFCS
jgi:hypothetical protein